MTRFGFTGISGIFLLLCGWAMAVPQAQIQTGVSANSPHPMTPGANVAGSPAAKQDQQKPNPGIIATPAPVVPQQQQVVAPLRPEQMPPVAPKVIYQNGLLSVEATNSTLSDVLTGIRNKTGIQIEGFQGAQERVAAKLGPAPAEAVLTGLLQGSHFDYMILGRPNQPGIVQRVILTPVSGTTSGSNTLQPLQPRPGMVMVQPVDDDEANPDEANIPQPQSQPIQPVIQPQPAQPQGNGLQGNTTKTPEQLLNDLKQIQQQQQNQQQNGQNPQPLAPLKPRIPQ